MKPKVAVVLPAYNLEETIASSLGRIEAGIENWSSEYDFEVFVIDDGSEDGTYQAAQEWSEEHPLGINLDKNPENLGLAETLRRAYQRVLESDPDFILKTDLDADYDQRKTFDKLLSVPEKPHVITLVGDRNFPREQNPYDFDMREDMLRILGEEPDLGRLEPDLGRLDPSTIGSQLYQAAYVRHMLKQEITMNHRKRWGMDLIMSLFAFVKNGFDAMMVDVDMGEYDPTRRPKEKVRAQYDAQIEIIGVLVGKSPQELSLMYGK
tara:strand:- start:473 stop:1267 length:795 start_codon:yes stop_codon:yes gene_type:complete